ncbi:MAG: tyrosine-type recombinase/integrase [Acidobacteriota bacterium]|jgi:site-specific recombinase XerD
MTQLPVEILSQDEVDRLIADPDAGDVYGLRDVAILSALYYAAATAGEIAALDVDDFDHRRHTLRLRSEEGKPRRVGVDPKLAEILERYFEESRRLLLAHSGVVGDEDSPAAFLTNKGHRVHVQDIRQILGGHAKSAGITTAVNYNTLRLSRAWHLRQAGEQPEKIQKLLGTASRSGRRVV